MSCPTCDHTMQSLGSNFYFWCPRCGTLMDANQGGGEAPELVKRCRHFRIACLDTQTRSRDTWRRMGIDESIYLPQERPE